MLHKFRSLKLRFHGPVNFFAQHCQKLEGTLIGNPRVWRFGNLRPRTYQCGNHHRRHMLHFTCQLWGICEAGVAHLPPRDCRSIGTIPSPSREYVSVCVCMIAFRLFPKLRVNCHLNIITFLVVWNWWSYLQIIYRISSSTLLLMVVCDFLVSVCDRWLACAFWADRQLRCSCKNTRNAIWFPTVCKSKAWYK